MTDKPDEQEYAKERVYTAEEIAKSCKRMAELNHVPVSQVLAFLHPAAVPETKAPDKALPEKPSRDDYDSDDAWLIAIAHRYVPALRQRAVELKEYGCHAYKQGFRDGISAGAKRAERAESALTAERQRNEGMARTISVLRGPEPIRADDLDVVGGQFAIKFTDGCDNGCVQLYSEDDGWWHCKDEGFSALWLGDLKSVVDRAIDAARSRQGAGEQ